LEKGVAKVDKAWLLNVTVGMQVAAIFFYMTAMITQHTLLKEFAVVGKVSILVTPVASVGHLSVICNPGMANKSFTF
jgi:hypothetical protein